MSTDLSRAEYVRNNRNKFNHYQAQQRDKLKLEMVEAYGGKCVHCNNDNPVVLTLDHIHDDAHVEKDLYGLNARGGHKHYGRLKAANWPQERFQLLCYNCNAVKEHIRRRSEMIERQGEFVPADRQLVQTKIGVKKNNQSGFKGVFWNAAKSRWQVRIMIDYAPIHLGFYKDIKEAALAYRTAAINAWGDSVNVPSLEEINNFDPVAHKIQITDKTLEEMEL